MNRVATALCLALGLSLLPACTATKEMRVRSALVDAGLSNAQAACMARPMAEQLSVGQLRDLQRLTGLKGEKIRDLSLQEVFGRATRVLDAPTLAVLTRAGLGCAIRG